MVNEIGAGIGGIAGLGGVMLIFRFLNAKIDKKQDKTLCENIAKNFAESLHKGEERFDKIIDTLGEIQVSNGKIEEHLKHLNGNTP